MYKRLCYTCKKNVAGKFRNISFTYLDMTVKMFKDGTNCEKCAQEVWIANFEENAKEFIKISKSGKPSIDWSRYKDSFSEGRLEDQKERFHYILISLGILSLQPEGNWEIVADGPIGLNPRGFSAYLYFVNKKDAIEFAKMEFSNTLYHWEIHLICRVITKNEILKGSAR